MDVFLEATITGLATAAILAVAASGLVLTYTTTGIFNFAHGAVGMPSRIGSCASAGHQQGGPVGHPHDDAGELLDHQHRHARRAGWPPSARPARSSPSCPPHTWVVEP
jgi:hypothetical protein